MTRQMKDVAAIQQMSVLYELSLSIGQSLDLRNNCESFLQILMARKNLSYAAVWIKDELLPDQAETGTASLVYAKTEFYIRDRSLPLSHPMFTMLADREYVAVNSYQECFDTLVAERSITRGMYILVRLGEIGILKLYAANENYVYDDFIARQLSGVISKFTISMEGCLAHQKLMLEIRERQRAEEALCQAHDQLEMRVRDRTRELIQSNKALRTEILERKRIEAALRKSEANNRALLTAIPDIIFRIDKKGTVLDVKAGKDSYSGIAPSKMVGQNVSGVFPGKLARQMMTHIAYVLQTGSMQIVEQRLRYGTAAFWEARIVVSGENEVLVIIRDITERKRMEEKLKYLSMRDALTGLYNRTYFEQEMHRLCGERYAPVGLIVCDVDGLKIINDTMGHEKGDVLLITAANLVKKLFRQNDVVARIGGDEFAVLLPKSNKDVLEKSCRKIREAVERYNAQNPGFPVSLSTGFAVSAERWADMGGVFAEADNNMYREKLHRSKSVRSSIVQALTTALEARDFITQGHAERLQEMAGALAKLLGLSERTIADIRLLAQFHDIGKVGVPDGILFKQGPLSPEEFVEMQRHSEIGFRIANSVPELIPIADWILKHHEWWNGGGYPLGLSGEEIPLECRIVAIADAFDAMTSDRPYRKAMSVEASLLELKRCAGKQFDPRLIEKFISTLSLEQEKICEA